MSISNNTQYVVVGFLCECENIKNYGNNAWVEVTGEIKKGSYHGSDMPILQVETINRVEKPKEEFVPEPDKNYIPTSSIL